MHQDPSYAHQTVDAVDEHYNCHIREEVLRERAHHNST